MPVYAGSMQQQQQLNGPMMPDSGGASYRSAQFGYQSPHVATVYPPQHGAPPPPPPIPTPLPDNSQYFMPPVDQSAPSDVSDTAQQFTADPRQVIN